MFPWSFTAFIATCGYYIGLGVLIVLSIAGTLGRNDISGIYERYD